MPWSAVSEAQFDEPAGRPIAVLAQATGFAAWCFAGLSLVAPLHCKHGYNKADIAKMTLETYKFEAFPSWSVTHADRICPDSLDEINVYMNNKDTRDPWGTPYRFACGLTARGSVNFYVDSAGEDRRFDTADDVRNNR